VASEPAAKEPGAHERAAQASEAQDRTAQERTAQERGVPAPRVILVMGVSASGKSTVGKALAAALGGVFIEADDYHSPDEIARMRDGTPLDDETRRPWLRRVRAATDRALRHASRDHPVVVACSALKASYRAVLLDGIERAQVVLLDVDPATLDARLRHRPEHFMPAGLLASQLADLERPVDAIRIDATHGSEAAVAEVLRALRDLPAA
jgi:gluconokinase